MPRVMISGWTRNTPTPMPVMKPDEGRDDEGDEHGHAEALVADERRDDEPGHGGDRADGQVDAAGQEGERLAGGRGSRAGSRRAGSRPPSPA